MTFTLYYADLKITSFRARSIVKALKFARDYGCMWTHITRSDGKEYS